MAKVVDANQAKRLNEWTYITYKRHVEHKFQILVIPNEVIPRSHVESDKQAFASAFIEATDECDHIAGSQLEENMTLSDAEYLKANDWGKCARRMAMIIRKLQPHMFYDTKNKKIDGIKTNVVNPFLTRVKQVLPQNDNIPATSSLLPSVSNLPSVEQVNTMLKPALIQLYASIIGDNNASKLTVKNLRLRILEQLHSQQADTTTVPLQTSATNTIISLPEVVDTSARTIEFIRVKHSAQVLSRMLYQLIENTVDYVDLTAILSKYNIDMGLFVNNNNTEVHAYYRARMLHAAILAELLPNGHDGVRQKFASIQQLATITTDSFTQLNHLRHELNRIKTEISLTVNNEQYPNYMWIDAFMERIQCPPYSKTMNAIEATMVEHSTTPLDFNEFMRKVIKHVEITTSININHIAMGPHYQQQAVTNDRIQVAQTKDQSSNEKCTFCVAVRKKYPHLKGIAHPTDECRRKKWVCRHCDQLMDNPKTFHFAGDCPQKELETTGKREQDKSHLSQRNKDQQLNRKRGGPTKQESDDNHPSKKTKYNSRQVMIMQQSDDEWDSAASDSEQNDSMSSSVKLTKRLTYSTQLPMQHPMIIDSGANQCTIPPAIANNVDYPKKYDTLHITGIGQLRLTANQAVTIYDIDHYIIKMDEGIISISKICQQFDIKAIFSKTGVQFTNNDMSQTYATGNLTNGLYVITFDQYITLLNQLTSYEVMRVNAAKTTLISKQCEAYIIKLHSYMGHASSMKMTNTIRSGITLPNPDNYDQQLHNTELLCKMITKYYAKRVCIACKIILHRRILHQPNITVYPTIPFEEITFDYKPSDIVSYDNNKGTFIAACMATTYTMQFPVRSTKQTLQALEYFIQVANSFGFKILRIRYDAAGYNDPEPVQKHLNARGIRGIPVAVGRQCRNFVEKIIDKIYKTYNIIQASQCLLNITYWPRGLDTAISYNNMSTNSRCADITPHEAVTKSKPRIQQYSYGQPVLINRQRKHFKKDVEYQHQNIMAIVIQIDNAVLFGVKVLTCITGKIAHGYYDMLGTIDFNPYDASQRQEIKQRYAIASTQQEIIQQLPPEENAFRFMDMATMHSTTIDGGQAEDTAMQTTHNATTSSDRDTIHPTTQVEHTAMQTAQNTPSDKQLDQVLHLGQAEILNKITPHLQIHSRNDTVVLQDAQYALLTEHEQKPKWHKIRHLQHKQQWINVARDEIEKLDANNVGEIVQRIDVPAGIQIIPTTLVLTYKKILQDDNKWGFKPRARLAGRGDLEHNTNDEECYAPTTYISTILTLLAIAVQDQWTIATFDVVGAFLKTPTAEELIYISLPGDILPKNLVIKLHKYLYGLKKANHKFNEHFHHILLAFGLQATITDICLYHNDDIRLAIFVDDGLLIARNPQVRDKLLQYLDNCIGIESHVEPKQYLKLEFVISPGRILIHQRHYIENMHIDPPQYVNLHKFMSVKYNVKYPIPNQYEEMRIKYINSPHCTYINPKLVQAIVGTLIYVIYSTRGELQIVGHYLSKHQAQPTEYDLFMYVVGA